MPENPHPERDRTRYKARYSNSFSGVSYKGVSLWFNKRLVETQDPTGESLVRKKEKMKKKGEKK